MDTCKIDGCNRTSKYKGKQLCGSHYNKEWNAANPEKAKEINRKNAQRYKQLYPEKVKETARKLAAKNAKNPVTIEHITEAVLERFYAKVDKTDTCWNWTGAATSQRKARPQASATKGYGYFTINGRPFYTHRLAMLIKQGYLSEGLVTDHLCNNSLCVNPDHIQETTNRHNVTRSPKHSMNHGGYGRKKNG